MALCPEHPKRDQKPQFTPLSETTSIPVCFIYESPPWGEVSLTSTSSSRDRNKYGGIRKRSINFLKGCSLCYCDTICRRVLFFVGRMNQIPPYLFLSRKGDEDTRDLGKHDFRSVLLQPTLFHHKKMLSVKGQSTHKIIVLGEKQNKISTLESHED